MTERTEYAVLRFLNQNGYCHTVNDFVKGRSIMQYVKAETTITKFTLFQWIAELAHQMEQYYKCEEEQVYGYVNPYAVIVTEQNEVLLLDTADQGNEELVKRMQKRKIRSLFVRKERVLSQRMRTEDDWYGFGRTMQFMMDRCHTEEKLTRKETKVLQRIAEKCLSGKNVGIRGWKETQQELRRLKNIENGRVGNAVGEVKRMSPERILLGTAAVVITAAAVFTVFQGEKSVERVENAEIVQAKGEEESHEEANTGGQELIEEVNQAYLELGLLYFVELGDYEKSCGYLEKAAAKSGLAEDYLKLVKSIQEGDFESYKARELESVLNNGENELEILEKEEKIQGKEYLYQMPFLCIYDMLETEEAWEKAVQIGEALIEAGETELEGSQEREQKVRSYLAKAYEMLGENQKAIEEYERIKNSGQEETKQEEVYLKLEALYELNEDTEKAGDIYREAVEKLPESERIRIAYIEWQCRDSSIERTVCAESIKKAITDFPELTENEDFQQLQEEFEITIEGEEICVGK